MMNFCKKSFICIYNKILLDIAFEIRCAESSPLNPINSSERGEKRKPYWRPYPLQAILLIITITTTITGKNRCPMREQRLFAVTEKRGHRQACARRLSVAVVGSRLRALYFLLRRRVKATRPTSPSMEEVGSGTATVPSVTSPLALYCITAVPVLLPSASNSVTS